MEMKEQRTAEACEQIYQNALRLVDGQLYAEAAGEFARIPDYRDAAQRKTECEQMQEAARKDRIYAEADKAAGNDNVKSQEKAIRIFQTIPGWRDADERVLEATRRIDEIIAKTETDRQEAIRKAEEDRLARMKRKKLLVRGILLTVAAAAVCVLGVFLVKKVIVPGLQYRKAVKLIEAEQTDEAYRLLHGLDFSDSNDLVNRMALEQLSDAQIGSTVRLGLYPQGRRTSEEKDVIEWIVLDRDESSVLLISKYALDCLPYQHYEGPLVFASWKTSQIRRWLNETFLNEAFDKGEIQLLVQADPDEDPDANVFVFGDANKDRVFLLSIEEAEKYFPTDESRKCLPTKYAIGYGAYQSSVGRTCFWWLRTSVTYQEESLEGDPEDAVIRAAVVGTSGTIVEVGHYMFNRNYCVRPVIRIETAAAGNLSD